MSDPTSALEPLREDFSSALVVVAHPDDMEFGAAAAVAIAAAVRRHRPDIVITGNFRDDWGPGTGLNQADHMATGCAVVDAVRDAGNRWVFHDQVDAGLEPWGGVREVWAASSPRAAHGVDVTATFDAGVAFERLPMGWGDDA